MKLNEFDDTQGQKFQTDDLYQRFTLRQISEARPQEILNIIMEKDRTIQAFSQQITKFKAQQLKAKKLISSLQQKIQKALPSANNTSNSFMIPSQFKSLFTTFMTSTVPSVFYDFTQCPQVYSILFKSILHAVYDKILQILEKKTKIVCLLLLQENQNQFEKSNSSQRQSIDQNQNLRQQIRYHLLSFLQKYFKRIFPSQLGEISSEKSQQQGQANEEHSQTKALFQIHIPTQCEINQQVRQKIETLNSQQMQQSEELKQFSLQLYQICIYMLLQQHPWQFVFDSDLWSKNSQNSSAKHFYTKKQFTCIDGFAKQASEVKIVLKGLRRKQNSSKEYHYHPNIKNFVLPENHDEYKIPEDFKLKTDILFLKEFNYQQKTQKSLTEINENYALRGITQSQNQLSSKLSNPPSFNINFPSQNKTLSKDFLLIMQNSLPIHNPKIISEQSFRLEAISQTQKSELIQSSLMRKQTPLIENESNCIIDETDSFTLKRKLSHKQQLSSSQEDKENVNENMNLIKIDKKLWANSKKEKPVLEKNMMKKHKKDKNNSTIDLTSQKHKDSQKDNLKENIQLDNGKKSRQVQKSSKKKTVGKSSRKCSVGKIISQSTQMGGSSTHTKQKISLSQHNTLVMKQPHNKKAVKENYFLEGSQGASLQDKQNMCAFVGHHMYEKQIMRPKKSSKLTKNEERGLAIGCQKEQRPLALRAYQNGCLVGKLREKYLVG